MSRDIRYDIADALECIANARNDTSLNLAASRLREKANADLEAEWAAIQELHEAKRQAILRMVDEIAKE